MTNKNDVLENSIDPVRHFNCLLYLLLFDDLSIITRLVLLLQCYLIV